MAVNFNAGKTPLVWFDGSQGLFQKIRAWVQFFRKRAKKGKIFENLDKNLQIFKVF